MSDFKSLNGYLVKDEVARENIAALQESTTAKFETVNANINKNAEAIAETNAAFEANKTETDVKIEELRKNQAEDIDEKILAANEAIAKNAQDIAAVQAAITAGNTVTPQLYGAKGDGVADDTAAIQAAIDNNPGALIMFPAGTYNISSPINLWRDSRNSILMMGAVTIKAISECYSVFNVGVLRTESEVNYASQIIMGGCIDCNKVASVGIYVPSNAGYTKIRDTQIRHIKNFGIIIGEDGVAASTQCSIDNVGLYGNYGDYSNTALMCYGTDNIITNTHVYLCGTGANIYADLLDNVHFWTSIAELDEAVIHEVTGFKVRGHLFGGTIYADSCATGVYLENGAKMEVNGLIYMTDAPIPEGIMIDANYDCSIRMGYWYAKENNFVTLNPLKLRNQPAYTNYIGVGRFKGTQGYDIIPDNFEPCNELNNAMTQPIPNAITRNYATITTDNYYLLGYLRKATSGATLRVRITNIFDFEFTVHTKNAGTAEKGSTIMHWGTANGSFYIGEAETRNGAEVFPLYYKATIQSAYNYITVDASGGGGLCGFYPVPKGSPEKLYQSAEINSILEIPTATDTGTEAATE